MDSVTAAEIARLETMTISKLVEKFESVWLPKRQQNDDLESRPRPRAAKDTWGILLRLGLCHSQSLASGKGVSSQLCEAPAGPFRQLTPAPFTTPIQD